MIERQHSVGLETTEEVIVTRRTVSDELTKEQNVIDRCRFARRRRLTRLNERLASLVWACKEGEALPESAVIEGRDHDLVISCLRKRAIADPTSHEAKQIQHMLGVPCVAPAVTVELVPPEPLPASRCAQEPEPGSINTCTEEVFIAELPADTSVNELKPAA